MSEQMTAATPSVPVAETPDMRHRHEDLDHRFCGDVLPLANQLLLRARRLARRSSQALVEGTLLCAYRFFKLPRWTLLACLLSHGYKARVDEGVSRRIRRLTASTTDTPREPLWQMACRVGPLVRVPPRRQVLDVMPGGRLAKRCLGSRRRLGS